MAPTVDALKHQVILSGEELSVEVNGPPNKYIVKDKIISSSSLEQLEIPAIDISVLSSCSPSSRVQDELKKLHSALSSFGYIQVINHGISTSFLDEVHEVTRGFFKLPLEEKRKYSRNENEIDGYGNDAVYSEHQILNWNDRLHLFVLPENIRIFEKWPENPESFRKILLEYTEKLKAMNEIIVKAIAKSLNLEENCFLDQFGENPICIARFNFYPLCPWPDRVLAASEHGDGSATTYLLQDKEVDGLQVLKDGKWYGVPLTPDSILFNVGDQLEIMSNGIFKSPRHRVVTSEKRERMTLGLFFAPERTSEVQPAEGLIDDKNPRLYKNVTDYSRDYYELALQGTNPIDAFRI